MERLSSLRVELSKEPTGPRRPDRTVDELEPIRRARKRVVDAIADGTLSSAQARAKLVELEDRERAALVREEDRKARALRERPEARAERLATIEGIRGCWRRISVPKRREALKLLIDRVEIRSTRTKRWEHGAWKLSVEWSA